MTAYSGELMRESNRLIAQCLAVDKNETKAVILTLSNVA